MDDLISRQGADLPDINVGDTIYRQAAIDIVMFECGKWTGLAKEISKQIKQLPSAQPDVPEINVGDINKFIDSLEEIFADIREMHGDDSVCGLCEYDGAYIGQSGDWCNECPGFDRDDCFKLSDKCRKRWIDTITKALPSAQPEQRWIPCSERLPEVGTYVLVSKKSLGFRSNLPNVCTAHRSRDPRSGKEEWNDMLFGKLDDDDVLAWMPLPEPYGGEQE